MYTIIKAVLKINQFKENAAYLRPHFLTLCYYYCLVSITCIIVTGILRIAQYDAERISYSAWAAM